MKLNVEEIVYLNKFVPRPYQLKLWDAFENKGYRKLIAIWPRRAGKDLFAFNCIMLREAIRNPGIYWYIWPTYAQGKKGFFDGMTNDGKRVIDYIPPSLVASINQQEQKIKLVNGSIIQVIGASDTDRLMGANPRGCIFSEAGLYENDRCRQLILPILRNNKGWELYISTPRGKNHLWSLWNIAKDNRKEWFSEILTIDDTKHISREEIRADIEKGEISEDLAAQEYWCSFNMGSAGSVYGHLVDKMRAEGRIGFVPYEEGLPVYTSWDLGINDPTCILFFQLAGQTIRIIDYYDNNRQPISHYVRYMKDKPYLYGDYHIAPHDIAVEEMTSGLTRRERFAQLGINFVNPTFLTIDDGIETVRATMPKLWIDEQKCKPLIRAMENYRYEWDERYNVYKRKPVHDQWSHAVDSLRYMCIDLHQLGESSSARDLDRRYAEAVYGPRMPMVFDDKYNRWGR